MNYEATIRQLRERRDFYAAAASALEKIHLHENGAGNTAVKATSKKRTRRGRPALALLDAEITRTLNLPGREAAEQLGVSAQTIYNRRRRLSERKPNGSAGEPITVVQ